MLQTGNDIVVLQTNQLPSPGEPAEVPEPTPFFSPKKQKTAEGHVVSIYRLWLLVHVVVLTPKGCLGQYCFLTLCTLTKQDSMSVT